MQVKRMLCVYYNNFNARKSIIFIFLRRYPDDSYVKFFINARTHFLMIKDFEFYSDIGLFNNFFNLIKKSI